MGSRTTADTGEPHQTRAATPTAVAALVAIVALGLLAGSSEITNTSIGWHLASGRWILANRTVPRSDPYSFTAQGTEWVDHEWLFQVIVTAVEAIGGTPLLVIFRAVLVAALAALIFRFGIRSGLDPPAALVLAALCLYGARIRFFLRPELATLLIAPVAVWIFLHRSNNQDRRWLLSLAGLMALGANLHAGILVVPPLLAVLFIADGLQSRKSGGSRFDPVPGLLGLAVAGAAPLVNPYGWRLYGVPLRIAHLVGLPEIPNPEWISPTPSDVPALYVALVAGLILLVARERRLARWLLFAIAGALALRYVRNVGLFFVLLPISCAPALAGLQLPGARRPRLAVVAAAMAVALIGLSIVASPHYRLSLDLSDSFYPHRACDFLEREALQTSASYNDVRFGGYLIQRYFPPRQVFLDDRNEIHQPLLAEIYTLFGRSDQAGWQQMLERYDVTVALLRYHPPFRVVSPAGSEIARRGFSTLWFPSDRWALVYWDDTAMVLVDRSTAHDELLARHEYHLIRPDDLEHLRSRLATEPEIRQIAAAELARKLAEEPDNRRALALSEFVLGLGSPSGTE